uniref:Uncharacterized protein n=1 Tax=Oryzias melastigma TaxID=30732 RepID=A0A3B3CPQ5_ORYME
MVPRLIIDFSLRGFDFNGSRSHIQQQKKRSVQQLHGKEVHLVVLLAFGVPPVLRPALGEEDQPVGFGGAEVERDGAHAFGVPLGQSQEGIGRLKVDGVQSGNVFTLEDNVALKLHLRVVDAGEPGELKPDVVVLIHHLGRHGGCI